METEQRGCKRLDVFQNNSLRRIFKIKWQNRTTTSEILQLSSMIPLSQEIDIDDGNSLPFPQKRP
jgi:hypothetical protein